MVDVCLLGVSNSLLEQVADLSNGRQCRLDDTDELLQHLFVCFNLGFVLAGDWRLITAC
jgi:hypothetical protein